MASRGIDSHYCTALPRPKSEGRDEGGHDPTTLAKERLSRRPTAVGVVAGAVTTKKTSYE